MPGASVLVDIKIADMTSVLFGPYCTQTLADLGAEVVKIEPEAGDIFRIIGKSAKSAKMGPTHLTVNRGKRSVVWDQKSDFGKEATRRLIEKSDVFIHNIRPDSLSRLNLTFEEVKAIKKDIVYVHCLGFGADGQYSGRPAYDDLIQGLSGITSLIPRVDNGDPRFFPMAVADKVAALHAVHATLAGIIERDRTGEAVHVEVPMFECVTSFVLEDHFDEATFDPPTGDFGYERQLDPTRQPQQTSDGWIIVAPYTDGRWVKTFNELLNAPQELDDERLKDVAGRRANRTLMQDRLQTYLLQNTTAYWLDLFNQNDIPVAPVNSLEDLQNDPHLRETEFFQRREHPTEGGYWEMQPPIRFNGAPGREIRPAQHLGQDTADVLKELDLEEP